MKSQRRTAGGQPPHLAWSSYLLLLVSLMAYNTWGCVTRGSGNDGLRLHGGNEDEAGFPQYLVNNTGYRICTVGWSVREAKAFCFSLGYEGFLGFNDNFTQAPESHDIMYRTFARCKGNEICIEDCEGHQWMKITKGVNNNGMSECYNQPSMEIRCSVNPPVTPTNPVAPAVAMALEPVTPRLVEEVAKNGGGNPAQAVGALAFGGGAHAIADSGQSKFASLQAAPTTTMSPMQLLAESFRCLVDPVNCIFTATTNGTTLFASTQTTPKTPSTAVTTSSLTDPSAPTTTPTLSTISLSNGTTPTTGVTSPNGTTPTTGPTTTPTVSSTTSSAVTTEGTGSTTPTTPTTNVPPEGDKSTTESNQSLNLPTTGATNTNQPTNNNQSSSNNQSGSGNNGDSGSNGDSGNGSNGVTSSSSSTSDSSTSPTNSPLPSSTSSSQTSSSSSSSNHNGGSTTVFRPSTPTTTTSSTSSKQPIAGQTTSDPGNLRPSTPSTIQGTTKKETTTKPVFTTPYTGPTTTTISTTTQSSFGALTTPTTKSPEGTTARPPLGVSSYGDNNECPGFTGTYQMETTTSGKLSSPNYPNNYPANIRCRWVIRVKAGNVVEFSFDDFKIHQYDYVRINDNDPQGSLITELSGDIADPNRIPVSNTTRRRRDIREKRATQNHVYATSGDQAYVDFYSDDAHTDRGFKTSFKGAVPASGAAEEEKANNNWIIIVIILLLLFLLIIALLLIYCWWKKKKEKQKCGFVIRDEKQLLYSKDGKMTVDPKSDYNAVAKSVESLFCVEGENDKANLIEGYKDTIVVFGNPSYRKKNNRVGSVTSLEQKSDDVKQQMASTGLPDPPSRPGSGMRTQRPFVKDGVVMMLPRIDNYTPDEGPPPQPQQQPSFERQMSNEQNETPRRKSLVSRDSKVAPLDPAGSNVKSTITMNPRSEATTDPEGVICANNKYSIVATVDGKKFGELDPVQSVPPDFLCPITNKLMKNPYMGNDGKSYEKKAISAWLAKKQTSPVTDEPMTEEDLKPNAALKSRIKQWKKQKEITKDRADREASASHTNAIGDIDC